MGDREIILLIKSRPSDGLYQAMKKYHASVKAVAARVLPYHPQDVEECVEDTFVNLWKGIDRIDPDTGTLQGLLLHTARNLAVSRYRKLRSGAGRVLSLELLDLAGDDDIADTVLTEQVSRELQELIMEMGEPDNQIFFRKYFLFEPVKRIALALALQETQVKNRLQYGRGKLRKQLEQRGISHEAI